MFLIIIFYYKYQIYALYHICIFLYLHILFINSNLKCETYCKATSYKKHKETLFCQTEWHDLGDLEFKQSNNIVPTDVTPILVSGEEFVGYPSRILTPMVWGMIPPWHKVNLFGYFIIFI